MMSPICPPDVQVLHSLASLNAMQRAVIVSVLSEEQVMQLLASFNQFDEDGNGYVKDMWKQTISTQVRVVLLITPPHLQTHLTTHTAPPTYNHLPSMVINLNTAAAATAATLCGTTDCCQGA